MGNDRQVRVIGGVVATCVALVIGIARPRTAQGIGLCIPQYGPCLASSECCSGRVCRSNICLDATPTCQGEGAVCTSSSQCCGSRVCQNLLCRTPVGAGDACGPAVPCASGLVCAVPQFTCRHAPPQFGEPCSGLVPCASGLACTALTTFVCVHSPAREGEHCDATAPCGGGLFCQAGTQTCVRFRTAGEGCSAVNPCMDGLACQACFVSSCANPFECFPNPDAGPLTDEQCRALYSPALQQAAENAQATMTYGGGTALSAGVSTSSEIGAAYGQDGRFGCYQSICAGINVDVSIGDFAALGFYDSFDSVGGSSFATVEDAGGELFSFSTSQITPYVGGPLIGTEDAFGIGASAVPFPVHAGAYQCQTYLSTALGGPNATPTPTPVADSCTGDCSGDGQVTVIDLITGVNIVLGNVALPVCPSFDRDGNGAVDVSEIITAVRDALDGCLAP